MKIWCTKKKVFTKNRFKFNCPCCKHIIILDEEVFKEHNKIVCCFGCLSEFSVVSHTINKTLVLNIILNKTNENETN